MTKYLIGDGEIVRQQNPEGVDVLMRIRPAEPIASYGEDLAELPRSRRVRQGLDAGMVAPFVHHEDAFPGPLDQTARGGNVVGHRLLDKLGFPEASSSSITAAWLAVGVATT
jgi:hypothetical protein